MNLHLATLGTILFKWTLLLAMAWGLHALVRRRHPHWRVILWRTALTGGVVVPLLVLMHFPAIKIPIQYGATPEAPVAIETTPITPVSNPPQPVKSAATAVAASTVPAVVHPGLTTISYRAKTKSISWIEVLVAVWTLGALIGGLRLVWLQAQLRILVNDSQPAEAMLQERLRQVQAKFGIRKTIRLQISENVVSPCACGVSSPVILLPKRFADELTADEVLALLAHEAAHFRQSDLFWCVAWRWTQALLWFHPLVWNVSGAHGLACEQMADRAACGQVGDAESYGQLLARLALRVLALPKVETQLALSASSQIARRLIHLKDGRAGIWSLRHSIVATAVAGILFTLVVGCQLSKSNTPSKVSASAVGGFKTVLITIHDDAGKPIAGASVRPTGFRVKGLHGADAYGWMTNLFGPPETVITDARGQAWLKYPVESIPDEKEYTRSLIVLVNHPDYCRVLIQDYPVEETNAPVVLDRGIPLEVTGYWGADHNKVAELTAILGQRDVRDSDWKLSADGVLSMRKLLPGPHILLVMGKLASGEIVYSDSLFFTAEKDQAYQYDLEMKPGIRLEGQLDASVPRPVKNGRVMLSVRSKEFPANPVIDDFYALQKTYGDRNYWHSYRPINEDGTFSFASIPAGEADVTVMGDGFATKMGEPLLNRWSGGTGPGAVIENPPAFPLTAPLTQIVVPTEPTATLQLKMTDMNGKPIQGVFGGLFPTAFRMPGMYGWQKDPSDGRYSNLPVLSKLNYSGTTDENGMLVISNLPAEVRFVDVSDERYQPQLQDTNKWRDRAIRVKVSPGETTNLDLALEPKGTDYIGEPR